MDHKSVAQRVLKDVGGAGNIVAAAHCATRLRLVLKNQDKVDQAAIDNDEDLKGSFLNAGQFQIIVGPGDVNEVHKHLIAAGAPEASKMISRKSPPSRVISFPASSRPSLTSSCRSSRCWSVAVC